jgi:hypothetical protein
MALSRSIIISSKSQKADVLIPTQYRVEWEVKNEFAMVKLVEKMVENERKLKQPSSLMKICTYNIITGHNNQLEQVMRCIKEMNIDMGILTETKLQGKHSTQCEGYDIIATKARSSSQGGVALVYRRLDLFHVKGTQ